MLILSLISSGVIENFANDEKKKLDKPMVSTLTVGIPSKIQNLTGYTLYDPVNLPPPQKLPILVTTGTVMSCGILCNNTPDCKGFFINNNKCSLSDNIFVPADLNSGYLTYMKN